MEGKALDGEKIDIREDKIHVLIIYRILKILDLLAEL